jgi:hypothetical protein
MAEEVEMLCLIVVCMVLSPLFSICFEFGFGVSDSTN